MVSPLMLTTNLYYMYYSHKWRMCGMWFYVSLITNCLTLKAFCCQWSSQRAVVAVVHLRPDSDKNYCCISSSYYILITFFSTRSVMWPRICRKCICGWGFAPDHTGGAHDAPRLPSRLGRRHPSPDSTRLGAGASTFAHLALGSARYR